MGIKGNILFTYCTLLLPFIFVHYAVIIVHYSDFVCVCVFMTCQMIVTIIVDA